MAQPGTAQDWNSKDILLTDILLASAFPGSNMLRATGASVFRALALFLSMEELTADQMQELLEDARTANNKKFNISCCRSYMTPRGRCYTCLEEEER